MKKTKLVKNFGKALVKHVVNGMKHVDEQEYQRRIGICNEDRCGFRSGIRCTHEDCGCYLDMKAWWESEHCPIDFW